MHKIFLLQEMKGHISNTVATVQTLETPLGLTFSPKILTPCHHKQCLCCTLFKQRKTKIFWFYFFHLAIGSLGKKNLKTRKATQKKPSQCTAVIYRNYLDIEGWFLFSHFILKFASREFFLLIPYSAVHQSLKLDHILCISLCQFRCYCFHFIFSFCFLRLIQK